MRRVLGWKGGVFKEKSEVNALTVEFIADFSQGFVRLFESIIAFLVDLLVKSASLGFYAVETVID